MSVLIKFCSVVESGSMIIGQTPEPSAFSYIQPHRSWFSRNWKWFVPAAIGVSILLVALFTITVAELVFGIMKSSDPYKHGIELVTHDPQAEQALGVPIKTGWLISGEINTTGSSGKADLSIPVHGSLHGGRLYVIAKKSVGMWRYEKIQLWIDGQPGGLDLLHHTTVAPEER
jgi:hypothetical protein